MNIVGQLEAQQTKKNRRLYGRAKPCAFTSRSLKAKRSERRCLKVL